MSLAVLGYRAYGTSHSMPVAATSLHPRLTSLLELKVSRGFKLAFWQHDRSQMHANHMQSGLLCLQGPAG